MFYRTKTYIAADWDEDLCAVEKLHEWNSNSFYSKLDFIDVHDFIQSRGFKPLLYNKTFFKG